MTYTPNVPQGNQTIASTTDPIRNNFTFIQTDARVEHSFNANVPGLAEGVHLKASMPNRALSPAIPAGANGIYFVSSGRPYFYDGSNNSNMAVWQEVLSGTYTPNSLTVYNTIATIPANKVGIVIFYRTGTPGRYVQTGQFTTDGTSCYGFSNRIKINGVADDYPIELKNFNSGSLDLQGLAFSNTYRNQPCSYKIFYRPI